MAISAHHGVALFIADPGPQSPEPVWVAVGEVTNYSDFGRVYEVVQHNSHSQRGTKKYKGTFNDGTLTLQLARDAEDLGQLKMREARDSDLNYNFKIELRDEPAGGEPSKIMFQALCTQFTAANIGGVNTVVGATAVLEIQPDTTVEIDPEA